MTTGISAADRARPVAVAIDPTKGKDHLVTPGHVFPLMAREGGVLVRAGHTEAAVDIARLAGLQPAGVICEIMNDDGTMARLPDLLTFAQFHGLKVGTIADLIAYRRRHDNLVACVAEGKIDSMHGGEWKVKTYVNQAEYAEHLALIKGDIDPSKPTLVRMHALSIFDDVLGEKTSNTHQLQSAMRAIAEHGEGVLVVIRDARPDRVSQTIKARAGTTGEEQVLRDYGIGAQILVDLGLKQLKLLTRSPKHNIIGLEGYGLEVVDEIQFKVS